MAFFCTLERAQGPPQNSKKGLRLRLMASAFSLFCRWCKFAKKAMTLRRNNEPNTIQHFASSSYATGSSSAFNSPLPSHSGFSTRTRLRPGGPLTQNHHFFQQADNPTSSKSKGSLPSFEEIGMRTLSCNNQQQQQLHLQQQQQMQGGQFLLNRRPYFSTMMKPANVNHHAPPTPLVKQKTAGCSSPRVQMYRTRVVYSDARDAIKAQEAAV